jgi:hypothetical protein
MSIYFEEILQELDRIKKEIIYWEKEATNSTFENGEL